MTRKNKKKINIGKDVCLMLAMFFLPFGYDLLFKFILDKTQSYWETDLIFYMISALFFISYFFLRRKVNKSD
jgi:hypothetical protein